MNADFPFFLSRGLPGLLLCLMGVLLAGCASKPAAPISPPPAAVPVPVTVAEPAADPIRELLAYHTALRRLPQGELQKELNKLEIQPASARLTLQKAIVLGLLQGLGDLARAQWHLEGVLNSVEAEAVALRPLALLLASDYAQQRRLGEQVDKLQHQGREQQRRIEQLNQMLEGLKAIERTLPARPQGAAAATAPAASLQPR